MLPLTGASFVFIQDRGGNRTQILLNGNDISNQVSDVSIQADPHGTSVSLVFFNPTVQFEVDDLTEHERVLSGDGTEVRLVRNVGTGLRK